MSDHVRMDPFLVTGGCILSSKDVIIKFRNLAWALGGYHRTLVVAPDTDALVHCISYVKTH